MIKGVIFDMDGVLADSHGTFNRLFTEVVKNELGIDISEEEFARYPGIRFEQRIEKISKQKGFHVTDTDVEKAIQKGRLEYYNNSVKYVKPFAGARELLEELKNSGIRIGLGTNGSRQTVLKLLDVMGIAKYFSSIVTFDDVYAGKPEPNIFLKNAEQLDVKPEECVVVEDAVEGISAARSAGMKIIAVATTQHPDELKEADLVVATVKNVTMSILKKL